MRGLLTWLLLFLSASFTNMAEAMQEAEKNNKMVDVNIGVIYDEDSLLGNMSLQCIQMALSDFYDSHGHYKTKIKLHTRLFPRNSIVDAAAAALYLLKNVKVKAIIGPITSMEAEFVIRVGEKARVPIISFLPERPFLYSTLSSYYIHMAQDDFLQVEPICALVKAFGWREVVPIYVKGDYASAGLIPHLADALQQVGAHTPYHKYHGTIPLLATDDHIRKELYKLKAMQSRVFLVNVTPELASRIFLIANEVGMMEAGYAWILTTGITNVLESLDDTARESMHGDGAICLKTYVPKTNELNHFKARWGREYPDMKLNVIGLWAYDAATALAKAVEQVGNQSLRFRRKKMATAFTSTDNNATTVSLGGPKLLQALLNSRFRGLAGSFRLTGGQLQSSTYQIVNVIGNSGRDVAFWTSKKGLVTDLNFPASDARHRKIIWPGYTTSPPTAGEMPIGGKKLRVGVPVKESYLQLVKVSRDESGRPVSTGFCIDVFNAAMEKLGYAGHYNFTPFAKPDGSAAGSYDDLVQQVSLQNYDIVVGDISIIASRTTVDFTLPYTESGVIMVVPVKKEKENAWVFLKPLTWELWVASLCGFIFIAFIIWILEHRVNEEFRGPLSHQAGTSLFFSFSMAVFAQRENVLNNLTRFVVIIWVFLVLVLTQSYTASLTSMLTVRKLQPTVNDIDELIHNGASVGFQKDSFVKELLQRKGFPEAKLISYDTLENLDSLLSKGSTKGGIAAVVDEIPYMKLFLAKYSSNYTIVQLSYKTDGFGFAFPKGSPLVAEVSRAILNVTQGDEMSKFEKKWGLHLNNDISDQENMITSESLSLGNFWGLFLIAGVASGLALFIFTATFLYENQHIWAGNDASPWSKIRRLATCFKQRDYSFYTFRRSDLQTRGTIKDDQIEESSSISQRSTPPHLCRPTSAAAVTELGSI